MEKRILILPRKMKLLLVILFVSLFFSCKKDNNNALVSSQPIQDTITQKKDTLIDYSKLMVIQNITAFSSVDSLSISDTIYHAKYIVQEGSQYVDTCSYYDVPTRSKCTIKFFLTVGSQNIPIEVWGYEPDGTVFESSEILKYPGKDSATFNMPISNKTVVNLVHI
ncbi:MAG TPA: hypothetical protein VMU83_20520 [Hanamia sp.]|nr:hypothetical protein [Hanamia sp.]